MPSFDAVNYSLRPNKTIQRGLVFDGLRVLSTGMPWKDAVYVGFGSIWFTDFVMAHKRLGVNRMISIEANEIGYRRASYNRPFRTVDVRMGLSFDLIPEFYEDEDLSSRPWLVWLDYDSELTEDILAELRGLVERAPDDSVMVITVDASEKHYGKDPAERADRLRALLGEAVPQTLGKEATRGGDALSATLADSLQSFLSNAAQSVARGGGFVPAFRLPYRDKAAMATVGGLLPSPARRPFCLDAVSKPEWEGRADRTIVAPHLTLKELAVLQAQLPDAGRLDRTAVQALGFDLGEEQIEVFRRYYKYYPAFAQISA